MSHAYSLLRPLLACPTAPFHEHHVFRWVTDFLTGLPHTRVQTNRFGNLEVHVQAPRQRSSPLLLVAHLDHPGFVVSPETPRTVRFLGGVDPAFFAGKSVMFYRKDSVKPVGEASIRRVLKQDDGLHVTFLESIPDAHFGQWKLPPPRIIRGEIQATAIDDLAGVAAILSALEQCSRNGIAASALLTRAEEVGFYGTLAWLSTKRSGPKPIALSIEMSNHRLYATPGDGPVLRVGDRATIFSADITRWIQNELDALALASPRFQYQRKLMAGGTCEATPFALAEYLTGALCLPLTGYHNMGDNNHIMPESIRLTDWNRLVEALVHLLAHPPGKQKSRSPLETRLKESTIRARQLLQRSALT